VCRWLKPRGWFLGVNYLYCDPGNPPFPTSRDELWQLFSPHFELIEDWIPRSYPNRTGKERMFWWRKRKASAQDPNPIPGARS
jgi:methyl halide transferase